jgi:HK97 family phage major capsid protein
MNENVKKKKKRQTGHRGRASREMLRIKGFAVLLLLFIGLAVGGSSLEAENDFTKTGGIAMGLTLAAPLAFAVPKELNLSDEDAKGLEALAKHLSDEIESYQKGSLESKELSEKIKSLFEEYAKEFGLDKSKFKTMEEALKAQGLELKALKENRGSAGKDTFEKQLKDFLSSDKFKERISSGQNIDMEIKAPAVMTTANAANAPHALSYEVLPGIQESPYESPTVFPSLLKGTTSSRTIIWINRVNKEGGAAFIAEGVLKPLMDWEYTEENSTARKIAVRSKSSTEMLRDFEYMRSEINLMLNRDLMDKTEEQILTGNGIGANPKGIITAASAYVGTGLDETIHSPTTVDALRAAMLQMRLLKYRPNVVWLNPTETAGMDLIKSDDGHYIKIETDGILRTLKVEESLNIPVGYFLMMDTSKWNIRVYEAFRLEFGWENDDFSKNQVTIIAEMRLHSYQNSIDQGSVLYDSIATIKEALAIPVPPEQGD